MEELLRLKQNIENLIEAGYDDDSVDDIIHDSCSINDLNNQIEDELSYGEA